MADLPRMRARFGRGKTPGPPGVAAEVRAQLEYLAALPRQLAPLYDEAPMVLRMRGGPHDGETVMIPASEVRRGCPPCSWMWAVIPEVSVFVTPLPGGPPPLAASACDQYDWAGSIDDDGHRLYRYAGRH